MILNFGVKLIPVQLLILALLVLPSTASSQSAEEIKDIFDQAESYFIYEEYELANQLYLLIDSHENMNIKYKIGACYLNIPSEKEKSIPYLEEAVKTATNTSKTKSYKETKAPLDAYFFLAKAYIINNEFDKGLSTLQKFTDLIEETNSKGEMENIEFINQQVQACKNAIRFKQVPLSFTKDSLGSRINLGSINDNPAVSFDGNTIVYTQRRGISNAIYFSHKENGIWQSAVDITESLKAGEDCSTCSLNKDGTELFLYKTDNYDGVIYSSKFEGGIWKPIKKLNKNINTKFYESHAAISSDGKSLYFTSNREGGQGNLDIYVSQKDASGEWGPAINLGPTINTLFNEDTPFITENDQILFFSSEGHSSMGGYDLFKSVKNGSDWKTPNNMGYPINTADDDKFLQPGNNGLNAYYTITTDYKKRDIFYLDLRVSDMSLLKNISGKFLLRDTSTTNFKIRNISVFNKITGDTLYNGSADQKTGSYSIKVVPAFLKILFTCDGFISQSIDTLIVKDSPDLYVSDVSLLKDTVKPKVEKIKYEKIDLLKIPLIAKIDTAVLVRNLRVNDAGDKNILDSEVLFYTVQVIALHKPVDISYFKYISDLKIMYNDDDKFYRYTTGNFKTKEEAYLHRLELTEKGYPDEIFVKKISKI